MKDVATRGGSSLGVIWNVLFVVAIVQVIVFFSSVAPLLLLCGILGVVVLAICANSKSLPVQLGGMAAAAVLAGVVAFSNTTSLAPAQFIALMATIAECGIGYAGVMRGNYVE